MSFPRLASRLCPETYRPDRPGLPIPSRSRVSVIAHRHPADLLWFRPPIRSYPSFIRRHLFPHGQSRSVRPWRFSPTPARGVRVRRTLVVLGSGGPMGTRGQIGPFPKSPRFPKIQFSQNRPKRPIRHTSPGFPIPEFSPPPRYPARSPRKRYPTQTNAQSIPIVAQRHDKCRTSDIQHKCRLPIPPVPPIHRHPPQPATLRAQCIANIARMSLTDRRHTRDLSPNHRSNAIHQANPYGRTDQGTDTPTGHPLRRITSVTHNPNSQFFLKSPASLPPKINPVHPNPPIPTYPHTHSPPP